MIKTLKIMITCLLMFSLSAIFAYTDEEVHKDKYLRAGYLAINNADQLELDPTQLKAIKGVTGSLERAVNALDKRIKALDAEINTLLWEAPFDTEAVNGLIASKHEIMRERDRTITIAHDRIYGYLTPGQMRSLSGLLEKSKE